MQDISSWQLRTFKGKTPFNKARSSHKNVTTAICKPECHFLSFHFHWSFEVNTKRARTEQITWGLKHFWHKSQMQFKPFILVLRCCSFVSSQNVSDGSDDGKIGQLASIPSVGYREKYCEMPSFRSLRACAAETFNYFFLKELCNRKDPFHIHYFSRFCMLKDFLSKWKGWNFKPNCK